ncbi:MAG TPA: sigma-54 dependent transcriptional regulator [Thermoanaerobaculia bacterium]
MPARIERVTARLWETISHHQRLADSIGAIREQLGDLLPVRTLAVTRVDVSPPRLEVVAVSSDERWGVPGHIDLPAGELQRLLEWERQPEVRLVREARREVPSLSRFPEQALLLPLEQGLVIAAPAAGRRWGDAERKLFAALREPFNVTLRNEEQLRSIALSRQSIEAENIALLHRLGRNDSAEAIVGAQSGLRGVMERVGQVASSDLPVLILGETGSGKEVIARAIHNRSARAGKAFVRVNCGAIAPELIDSELFGHERGSFTGATSPRKGWFERADRGTLLLDEIGELPLPAQVRLLRILQDGSFHRVGGQTQLTADVRIVAATHRDLQEMVRERTFREDLWYRIAVFPIALPALRERPDDIPELAMHFARRACIRFGLRPLTLTRGDIHLLLSYDWPGNIRELGAVIDRAAILGDGEHLDVRAALGTGGRQGTQKAKTPEGRFLTLDEAMREHIEEALRRSGGTIEGPRGAAALLDINPYTLRARMRKLGVEWSRFRG